MNTNDKLPAEWEAIVGKAAEATFSRGYTSDISQFLRDTVEHCYALHTKPKRELTDAELCKAYDKPPGYNMQHTARLRAVIAAHEAKQREPETVTFRAARSIMNHSRLVMLSEYSQLAGVWEWLDIDGKPQTFEVKL